ncbi:MAG: GNAT family N-acetyltransferase [Flavobacterium sp.]|nr:GNAT family N-acetyltransferase [Flavobacterium sp.]
MNLILETERLVLRPLELSDTDAFFAMNDNPNVAKYLRIPITSLAEAETYIQKIITEYQQNSIGRFAVILKENKQLIGFSGLKFRKNEENNHQNFYDLGYRFSEEHWNKGFATEAALAWIEYGFKTMQLPSIHACAENENKGSNHVLKKIGFVFTNQYYINQTLHNWYQLDQKNYK